LLHAACGELVEPEGEVGIEQAPHAWPVWRERDLPVPFQLRDDPRQPRHRVGNHLAEQVEPRLAARSLLGKRVFGEVGQLGGNELRVAGRDLRKPGLEAGRPARRERVQEVGYVAARPHHRGEQPHVGLAEAGPDRPQPPAVQSRVGGSAQRAQAGDGFPGGREREADPPEVLGSQVQVDHKQRLGHNLIVAASNSWHQPGCHGLSEHRNPERGVPAAAPQRPGVRRRRTRRPWAD
jgi:hypothetical protein